MKKLVIAFLGIFLLLNVACSRDDNDTVSIVGTWNVSSVKMKGTLAIMVSLRQLMKKLLQMLVRRNLLWFSMQTEQVV